MKKALIIHADDFGMCHSVNQAIKTGLNSRLITSTSLMVPCPWFGEAAQFAVENRKWDVGLHLTLTSEWPLYKWGPVAPKEKVLSLLDSDGFFVSSANLVKRKAKPQEVAIELRAQIQRALKFGIRPSHLDSHMFTLFASSKLEAVFEKIANEVHIPRLKIAKNLSMKLMADRPLKPIQLVPWYKETLRKKLRAGQNQLLIHPGIDNDELRTICGGQLDFGSRWRQNDLNFFTSNDFKALVKKENIGLINWRGRQS